VACLDGLFGFAMTLAQDRVVAEDLVQETYLRALSARRKAAPSENLRGWLFTIVHNTWRNQVRRPRLERLDGSERTTGLGRVVWLAPPPDPEQELERARLRESLRSAIDALPIPFREVVVLRCVEEFSYQEIASILGCPTGTVMSRLARGRVLVRERLMQERWAPRREAAR
jgi:RNA polymerase sigma-70 factor (ECF subfamily)